MFIRTIVKEKGMTLMSVLVATALSGIIGLIVIRLMGNQAEAMLVVKLREEREFLIKHYRQIVIGGWDKTMASTNTNDPTVATRVLIRDTSIGTSSFPVLLRTDCPSTPPSTPCNNLHKHNPNGWWKVDAKIGSPSISGKIQHSDDYSGTTGLTTEKNYTVTLSVDFDPTKHPVVKINLATRQEILYMGYRWQETKQSGCDSDSNTTTLITSKTLTRQNIRSGTPVPLYHPNTHDSSDDVISGQGAIISYSFHSNYAKCSQVPLVSNKGECPPVSAILGFESWHKTTRQRYYRKNVTGEYVTGRLACSYPDVNYPSTNNASGSAWKNALKNGSTSYRYYTLHNKVMEITSTPRTSSTSCPALDRSYIDSVTSVVAPGTEGGELTCENNLIAPQTLSIAGTTSTDGNRIGGCSVSSTGYTNCSRTTYRAWNGVNSYDDYTYHAGGGGYQTGQGSTGIRSIGHSGGIKEFDSTGSAIKVKPQPMRAYTNVRYNVLRGRPGVRGDHGDCDCKEDHPTISSRALASCRLNR